jgi:3-hydroxyisobutyrate dehydrogenase-like beta-hydroxyacid dehydrogenase
MVERLLAVGRDVRVVARRPEVRERFAGLGAEAVGEVTALGACGVVVCCLFDDTQLAEVLPAVIEGLEPGALVISHTTGAPDVVRELGDLALARGVSLVDAPFSGTAADVRAGTLTVLLGAEPSDTVRARAVVEAYADPVIHTGPPGSALQVKLLNNSLFTAISQLTLTALLAAEALGVSAETLWSVLAVSSGGSKAADYIGRHGGAAEFVESVADVLDKDVAAVRRAAEWSGLDIGPILRAAVDGPLPIGRR